MSKVKKNVAQTVTNSIVNAIENNNVLPWVSPYTNGVMVQNLASKKSYRGINIFLLWCSASENGFTSPYWLTFKQARDMGGNVKKGSKGTSIVFFKILDIAETETEEGYQVPVKKFYTVFNLDQIEGIDSPALPKALDLGSSENVSLMDEYLNGYLVNENIEITEKGEGAYYSPVTDKINMPLNIANCDEYAATKCHEVIHSTGHKSRLDRFSTEQAAFNTKRESYAAEELTAEMGAAIICASLGITSTYENHISYLDCWLKQLKSDSNFIFQAASKAQKAIDLIESLSSIQEKAA